MMIKPGEIRRLNLGHYTMPPASRLAGQKIVACAYLVRYDGGVLLFDTGLGSGHPQADREFGPMVREPLRPALAAAGLQGAEVTAVANCHLHLDHCGNNPLFPGTPIFVQQRELDALPELDYVLPELIDFDGALLAVHDGEADVAPGLRIVPTPGHTPGHQSLLVDTSRGRILLAGQAFDSASDYGRAQFSLDVAAAGDAPQSAGPAELRDPAEPRDPAGPDWLAELGGLDVRRVLFAHDLLAWDAGQVAAGTA
jgi:glyoxylase-like metal-dependent hydrolase (beta-lactamase superfamily II)